MSAANAPMMNLAPYNNAPPELQTRARQLGSLVARVSPGTVGLSGFRKQLDTFYGSYIAELQDRGFPIWHPLPFQVPDDREGVRHPDEFLLGDEMLVAPIYEPGDKRTRLSAARHLDQPGNQPGHAGAEDHHGRDQIAAGFRAQRRHRFRSTRPTAWRCTTSPSSAASSSCWKAISPTTRRCTPPPRSISSAWRSSPRRSATTSGWSTTPKSRPASSSTTKQYREVSRLETLADDCWFYDAAQKNLHVRVKVKAGEDCIINLNYQ